MIWMQRNDQANKWYPWLNIMFPWILCIISGKFGLYLANLCSDNKQQVINMYLVWTAIFKFSFKANFNQVLCFSDQKCKTYLLILELFGMLQD